MPTSQTGLDRANCRECRNRCDHRPADGSRRSSALLLLIMLLACVEARPASAQPPGVAPTSTAVVEAVRTFVGFPYRLGGDSAKGLDCSALIRRTFRTVGLELPRTAARQFKQGCAVAREELMAGDLLFFHGRRLQKISHVGIYVGGGRFIHAARHGVVVASLQAAYWSRRFAGARRLIEAAPAANLDADVCIDGQ